MIKKLLLVRHASSDYAGLGVKDIDRMLNDRGIQQAHTMAAYVKDKGIRPDIVLASPAKRTHKTALFFVDSLGIGENKINLLNDIYEAEPETLLDIIHKTPNEIETLMIVGHNPSIALLSSFLSSHMIDEVPTCGVVDMAFDVSGWDSIREGDGMFISLDVPDKLVNQGGF